QAVSAISTVQPMLRSAPVSSRREEILDLPNLPCIADDECRIADELQRCRQIYVAQYSGGRVVGIDPQERARVRIGRRAFVVIVDMGHMPQDIEHAPWAKLHVDRQRNASYHLDRI